MKNADMPAMPVMDSSGQPMSAKHCLLDGVAATGFTKREMMAMSAMHGLCAHSGDYHLFADLASDAVNYADALLAELDRTKGELK